MTASSTPSVFLSDPDVTLWHGDVLETLRELPAESVDCVVTSPPYWGLRDYGQEGQLGLESTPEQYVERMVEVFREVRRVLAAHGTVWLNLGDSYAAANNRNDGTRQVGTQPDSDRDSSLQFNQGTYRKIPGLKPKDLVGIPWRVAFALQQPYYTGKIKDERERIWLAATVEAEGCLFIHKRKAGTPNYATFTRKDGTTVSYDRKNDTYGAGLEVSSTDRVVVERCMEIAGIGSINEQTPEQNKRRKQTIYRWHVRSNECKWIIRELYPHFIAKQHEARLLIGCPSKGDDARKAWESLKALHQGQTASMDFAPPEGMWERGWFLRSEIIWAKCRPNPMPESVTDRPTKAHEQVFLLSKQPRYFFDQEAVREAYLPDSIARDGRARLTSYAPPGQAARAEGERCINGGRNIRSVWEIATQPYPEAHFATFPEELARRCIAAGCPEQVCRVCGRPGGHEVVRTPLGSGPSVDPTPLTGRKGMNRIRKPNEGTREITKAEQREYARQLRESPHRDEMAAEAGEAFAHYIRTDDSGARPVPPNFLNEWLDRGWLAAAEASDCGHADYRPGIVLDPFVGSGTVAHVARKLGRHSIGIDLSAEYLALAARRLQQQSLFTEVAS